MLGGGCVPAPRPPVGTSGDGMVSPAGTALAPAGDGALGSGDPATGIARASTRCVGAEGAAGPPPRKARIAPSKVSPWALSMCAALLLPSPITAASTIAPLISRLRPCWAAAAAASRIRRRSPETTSWLGLSGGERSSIRPRWPEMSALSLPGSTLLAARTRAASGSSSSASSICSSVTSRCAWARAYSVARDSVAARLGAIGMRPSSATAMSVMRLVPARGRAARRRIFAPSARYPIAVPPARTPPQKEPRPVPAHRERRSPEM